MPDTYRGHILRFQGSWGSGLAALLIKCANGKLVSAYCENGPTVRALEACFGGVMGPNHTADVGHLSKREVVYSVDDMNMLVGFTPVEDWEGSEIPDEGLHERD